MSAPTVTIPTTGTDPKNATKEAAEAAINGALSTLHTDIQTRATAASVTALTTTVNGKASQSDLTALESRLGAASPVGPARPGDYPLAFGNSKTAVWASQGAAPGTVQTDTDMGLSLQVAGAGVVAARASVPVLAGRIYQAFWIFKRTVDSTDPLGDAIVTGLQYLTAAHAANGAHAPAQTAVAAQGLRMVGPVTFSLDDPEADVTVPAGTKYVKPYIELFGATPTTRVGWILFEELKEIQPADAQTAALAAAIEAAAAQGAADDAAISAAEADADRIQTENARDGAIAAANSIGIYSESTLAAAITAGLAAATEGQTFHATGADVDYVGVYKDLSGVAVEQTSYRTSAYVTKVKVRTMSAFSEQASPFEFDRHPASSGVAYDADGNWTVAAGAYGLWIIPAANMTAVAGAPLAMAIRVKSGAVKNASLQQYNGGTLLLSSPFELIDDILFVSIEALQAGLTTIRLEMDNTGGGAVAAVLDVPQYTVSGELPRVLVGDRTSEAKTASELGEAAGAANRFRDDWTVANIEGSGANVVRINDDAVIPATRNARIVSTISGLDHTEDVTVECRSDRALVSVSIEFLFAGGTPSPYLVGMRNRGGYWSITIPAGTMTASPVTARFIADNRRDATYSMSAVGDAKVSGFTIKNTEQASGKITETWHDRKHAFRLDDVQQQVVDDLNRRRLAMTAAKMAEAMSNPLHVAQSNMAMTIAMQTSTMWVDHLNGNDSNNGATMALPKQTLVAALAATSAGDAIMLRNGEGQDYDIGGFVSGLDRSLYGWGDGTRRARIDVRQKLSGVTWTNETGNVWRADVTHRDPLGTVRGGVAGQSNLYNFWLWFPGDVSWTYLAGSDGIAARIAAVGALPGSGFVHKTGSTNSEPRDEAGNDAATGFRYYVHMPDGSDPNGKDIRVADRQYNSSWAEGVRLQNLDFIGAARKDNVYFPLFTTATENVPILDNCRMLDCPEHGFIGLVQLRNYYFASGRAAPGTSNAALGRSLGYGANWFTGSTESPDVDLTACAMEVTGFNGAVFGHGADAGGGATGGFNSLYIPCLIATNCGASNGSSVVSFTPLDGFEPFLPGGCRIGWIDATEVSGAFGGSVKRVDGGWLELDVKDNSDNQVLFYLEDIGQDMVLSNLFWTMGQQNENGVFLVGNFLDNTTTGWSAPSITFDGCRDLSPIDQKAHVVNFSSPAYLPRVDVTVSGRSKLGALIGPNNDYLPDALTIDAGSESGLFDEDRAAIVARMTAGSKTATISEDARIVSHTGIVISDIR